MNNTFNNLPPSIQDKWDVLCSEEINNHIIIFINRKEYWGVLQKRKKIFGTAYTCIVEPIFHSIHYEKSPNLIVAVDGKSYKSYSCFDNKGLLVGSFVAEYATFKDDYIIKKNVDQQYDLLDNKFNTLVVDKEALHSIGCNLFAFRENEKYGILNNLGEIIIPPTNVKICTRVNDNKIIVETIPNQFCIYDIHGNIEKKLIYNRILAPYSNTYLASKDKQNKFKTIIGKKVDDYLVMVDYLEMVDYDGKWGIINDEGIEIIPNEYDYIDFFRSNDFYKVGQGKIHLNQDEDSDIYIESKGSSYLSVRDTKWGVIDSRNNIVVPIEYDWIEEILDGKLWAVNKGGTLYYDSDYKEEKWTIDGGTWGVINNESKLVVPMDYEEIVTSWFRVKDYIFVKKMANSSNDYDYIYDFDGNIIVDEEINIKNHTFYP